MANCTECGNMALHGNKHAEWCPCSDKNKTIQEKQYDCIKKIQEYLKDDMKDFDADEWLKKRFKITL